MQRERITGTDTEAFGTTAGCTRRRSGKRSQAYSDPCPVRLEECLKTTPEGLSASIEDERREEVGSAEELAAPQELKDVPIPPDSDPRKRRAMKAAIAVASSGSSQMDSNRAVTDESRMDVEGEERDESRASKAQNIRRRILTKTSMEEVTNG